MISLKNIFKVYESYGASVNVISNASIEISKGEFCTIVGSSGSGKTTILNIIGLLDRPSSGECVILGKSIIDLSDKAASDIRERMIGFVFQSFHLLPRLTAIENVGLPLIYRGIPLKERRLRAVEALDRVGLENRSTLRPDQLSGGQKQRVAIARALVGDPVLLLADEPTGNLDSENANIVMELLLKLNHEVGLTTIMVTHDPTLAARARRRIIMHDGRVQADIGGGLHESRGALPSRLGSAGETN